MIRVGSRVIPMMIYDTFGGERGTVVGIEYGRVIVRFDDWKPVTWGARLNVLGFGLNDLLEVPCPFKIGDRVRLTEIGNMRWDTSEPDTSLSAFAEGIIVKAPWMPSIHTWVNFGLEFGPLPMRIDELELIASPDDPR